MEKRLERFKGIHPGLILTKASLPIWIVLLRRQIFIVGFMVIITEM